MKEVCGPQRIAIDFYADSDLEENWYLASTYKSILERVYSACKDQVEIRLNTQVKRIVSEENFHTTSKSIMVILEDERELRYDELIVTCPLGWLKHNKQAFTPRLPVQMLKAIDHIGYGRLEKVYITFDRAFWQTNSSVGSQPFIFRFLEPAYAHEHNPDQRTVECVSLAALPQTCRQNTLLFYLNGPTSEYLTTLVRDLNPGSKERYAKLVAYFSPYYSKLPDFEESCQPIDFCSTDWQNDELAGFGSYSTYQVSDDSDGLVELDKDIEILRIGTSLLPSTEQNVKPAVEFFYTSGCL